MPSILSRLRMRTLSQQSNASAHSAILPVTVNSDLSADVPPLLPSRSEPMLVDRRITEDLPALLGTLETSTTATGPVGALKPPRPRRRSGLRTLGLGLKDDTAPEEVRVTLKKENNEFTGVASNGGPSAWKGKQDASRVPSTNSPWSTFGRHRQGAARSPYDHGSSHPPSARSSRMASADSAALCGSPMAHLSEGRTVSNLASSTSFDHTSNSNSRPTDSSRDLSVLSVLAGTMSNQSSHSPKSVAITFGRQSPPLLDVLPSVARTGVAYTSMPVLPSTYSTDSVMSRGNTFPRRHKRSKTRSKFRSRHRDILYQFNTSTIAHDPTSDIRAPHDTLQSGTETETVRPSVERPAGCLSPDDAGERSPSAITGTAPHALHALCEVSDAPCSPPLIPLSLSSFISSSPPDAEAGGGSGDILDNLSDSSRYSTALMDENCMDAASTPNEQPSVTRDALQRDALQRIASRIRTGTPSKTRKRISRFGEQSSFTSSSPKQNQNGGAGPSTATFPTKLTPSASQRIPRTPRSEPILRPVSENENVATPLNNKGKRKAEDVDLTPPGQRAGQHATFVIPTVNRRSPHASEVSGAPSSYNGRKRARLSTSTPTASPEISRPASIQRYPTDSWPSRSGLRRAASKTASTGSVRPESPSKGRRRSMSELSISFSALVTPRAPSVSISSNRCYMRDPRTAHVQRTSWTLRRRSQDDFGSPNQAWMFFIGFILFPLWWLGSFWRIPQTRRVDNADTEKAGTFELDDPQVEHDARSWRFRCRIMSVVSLFTYIPFIILVAVFVTRS